jgi:outer membrane protein TolC
VAAEQVAADAASTVTAASARVDLLREEQAAGRASRGDVDRARKGLAQAQEVMLQAQARCRVLVRDAAALVDAEREDRERVRRARAAGLAIERDALEKEILAFLERIEPSLLDLDRRIQDWDSRATGARSSDGLQPGRLNRPSRIAGWDRLIGGVGDLRRGY